MVNTCLIDRHVPSKVIRRRVNDKPWLNEVCINAFQDKQDVYHLWSQNRSLLWEVYVMHRRDAQSVFDAASLEYNNIMHASLSTMNPHKLLSTQKKLFLK